MQLFIVGMCTLLIAAQANITIKPITNTSILAEDVGVTSLFHRTWKLIIGVDTSNIDSRFQQIQKVYQEASKLCVECNEEFEHNAFNNRINRLTELKDTLHQILGFSRTKRGILNNIGSISKTLFGTLDEEDMETINLEFDKIYGDQKIITNTIGNQTRIIKTLLNSASHDLQLLNEKSGRLTHQLNQIINVSNSNARNLLTANIITLCTIAIGEFSKGINLIINAINDGKHGIVYPQILKPTILIQELQLIEEETNTKYPIKLIPQNYQRIVDISEITISIINKKLVYILQIPELELQNLLTLHFIPIPIRHGNSFIAPNPSHEIILLNAEKSFYIPSDLNTLQNCKKLENQFICKRSQPTFLMSKIHNCEINIIRNYNKIISNKIWEFSVFKISEIVFIPLHDRNQYIVIPENEVKLTTSCNSQTHIVMINEPSLIYSDSDCTLQTSKSMLKLHTSIEHNFHIQFKKNISYTVSQSDLDLLISQLPVIQE